MPEREGWLTVYVRYTSGPDTCSTVFASRLLSGQWVDVVYDRTTKEPISEAEAQAMADVLCEAWTPPQPAFDEPLNVGAVVEDTGGNLWTRIAGADADPGDAIARTHASPPWRRRGKAAKWWRDLRVVRVLSHGWTEGEAAE